MESLYPATKQILAFLTEITPVSDHFTHREKLFWIRKSVTATDFFKSSYYKHMHHKLTCTAIWINMNTGDTMAESKRHISEVRALCSMIMLMITYNYYIKMKQTFSAMFERTTEPIGQSCYDI